MRSSASAASGRPSRPAALIRGARRKPIAPSSQAAGSTPATRISARSPGFCVCASRRRPSSASARFSSSERHDVGDGREGDDVEVALEKRMARSEQRLGELPHDGGAAETGERVVALQRRDDRAGRERVAGAVVIGDDHLEPEPCRLLHFEDRRDSAVDGEHEADPVLGQPGNRLRGEAVALLEPRREVPRRVGAELAEQEHGERGGTDPVGVVVAVDADALPGCDRGADALHGLGHVAEPERVVTGKRARRGSASPRRDR